MVIINNFIHFDGKYALFGKKVNKKECFPYFWLKMILILILLSLKKKVTKKVSRFFGKKAPQKRMLSLILG